MLITPQNGTFLRICKVFTNMPLAHDRPVDMGVQAFCRKCGKCARACPVGAVSDAAEPSYDVPNECSRPGVLRWPVNGIDCHAFWRENGTSCSTCMAACPFTEVEG